LTTDQPDDNRTEAQGDCAVRSPHAALRYRAHGYRGACRVTEEALLRISQRWARRLLILVPAVLLVLFTACSDPMTTIEPKSDFTEAIQGVYEIVFWLSMFVFVAIMLITLWLAVRYRERPGRVANQIHGNTRLEVLWTIIPVAIVLVMLVPTWQVIADTTATPPDDSMVIEATGKQWWFEFKYPELGITTANELHLSVDRPAHVKLYSDDVIHSFWIPQLAGKVDMVPGHENDLWFTPDADSVREEAYLGQCVEFCGASHANMRFRVYVHTAEEFDAWVQNELADAVEPTSELGQLGATLFVVRCAECHTIRGTAASIADFGPDLTHVGSRETIAAGILDNNIDNLVDWISNPAEIKPGINPENDITDKDPPLRFMRAFEEEISAEDILAIATYLSELK